jgi:hypothetical protein
MANPEESELAKYIDDLIAVTSGGDVKWMKANPTTAVWDNARPPRPVRLVLQQVGVPPPPPQIGRTPPVASTSYHFQAIDLSAPNPPAIVISGAESNLLNEKLGQLFDAINTSISRKGLDFLRAVIDDAKRKF